MPLPHVPLAALLPALLVSIAPACRPAERAGGAASAAPTHVVTALACARDEPVYLDGLGSAVAQVTAVVRSQVDGRIVRVHFKEGARVAQGAPLADLDDRPYRIAVAQAQATLMRDEAVLRNSELTLGRNAELLRDTLVAQSVVTDAQALRDEGAANVAADRAALAAARLQLEYAHVVAPIAGRTGVRLVDPGNMVRAGDANGLVVITQTDPIAVISTVPEAALPALRAAMARGPVPVQALGPGDGPPIAVGTLDVLDNRIDASTGTLRLKSLFANADEALWPNQFVRTRFLLQTLRGAVVVPEQAVQHGPDGAYVLVIDAARRAQLRPVQEGSTHAGRTHVVVGLTAGERVVVEGQHRLHEGAAVTWDEAPPDAGRAPAPASAGAP